ncbi:hypothetical protein JW848_02350 [Candidatus Bipolaricaulota bacterium]|nr:hypothetical protein [Candidatus Bipolaricaulota bacterium]
MNEPVDHGVRVLSLFSGSLASQVATELVARLPQVEEVCLLHFRGPLFEELDHFRETLKLDWANMKYRTQSLKREVRQLVSTPTGEPFSIARTCFSCRSLLLTRGVRYMERIGAQFLVTGEVAGEHGLSVDDLALIAARLGASGRIFRPLSAKLLPPLDPDVQGVIGSETSFAWTAEDADALESLANEMGIYTASGAPCRTRCKLMRPGFGERLTNLFREEGFTLNGLKLLDFDLYYKLPPDVKIVLAISEEEKRALQNLFFPNDLRVYLASCQGPMALVRTAWEEKSGNEVARIIEVAARIAATHGDVGQRASIVAKYRFENEDETSQLTVQPFETPAEIARHCIGVQC